MKVLLLLASAAALSAFSSLGAADDVKLPDENGTRKAVSCAPFPAALSAFVWRNWGLVDASLLAETVGATKDEI